MKAADCGRLAWALKVSGLEAMRGAAASVGRSLIYAPGAPVYGMTPAPALPYETRLYEEELTRWARHAAAYILMAADARARECLQKAIAAKLPPERYSDGRVYVPISAEPDVLTAVTLHCAYAAGADVCRLAGYSTDAIYTPNTKRYEALKEWSRDISSKAIVHAAAQAKKQFDGNYAELRLQAQPCTPRFSVFETKTGIYEREILINLPDKNIAPAC